MSDLLTVDEAAVQLRISPDTVRDWARRGIIPAAKIGKAWRFPADMLLAHLADAARANLCSTVALHRPIGGADSQLVAARFDSLPEPQTARRQKNTNPALGIVTGGKPS